MNTINNTIITNELIGTNTNQLAVSELAVSELAVSELEVSESVSMDKPGFKIINKVSWIEMCYEEEEEEERRKKEEKEKKMKALSDKRKALHEIGEYELEEGEIFD